MEMTAELARKLFHYNPETGEFKWKKRDENLFEKEWFAKRWNTKHAGKSVGCPNSNGYIHFSFRKKFYLVHRVVWLYQKGEWPLFFIDHLNGDKSDNRMENLRDSTPSESSRNTVRKILSASGFKGVSWSSRMNKWEARIGVGLKTEHLGVSDDKEIARELYKKRAAELGFTERHIGD